MFSLGPSTAVIFDAAAIETGGGDGAAVDRVRGRHGGAALVGESVAIGYIVGVGSESGGQDGKKEGKEIGPHFWLWPVVRRDKMMALSMTGEGVSELRECLGVGQLWIAYIHKDSRLPGLFYTPCELNRYIDFILSSLEV